MANNKSKIQLKVEAKKKAVKPTLSKGSGGLLSARIVATVKKKNTG